MRSSPLTNLGRFAFTHAPLHMRQTLCGAQQFIRYRHSHQRSLNMTAEEANRMSPSMADLGLKDNDQVTVAMSGGVDSSLTLRLLSELPLDLRIIFMKNWDPLLSESPSSSDAESQTYSYNYSTSHSASRPNLSPCAWQQDWEDVQNVARHVGIQEDRVKMVDLSSEYWGRVFEPSLRVWEEGRTPNPDVGCNREIKFGALLDCIPNVPRSFLATGHYAKVQHLTHTSKLYRARDMNKDQSYYLSSMTQEQLRRAIFPLADIPKPLTRKLAEYYGLPTAVRRESMGLCFVGKRANFGEFISQYITKPAPGYLVDQSGKRLAPHTGMWFYTEGQKAKVGGMTEAHFVAKKRIGESGNDILVVPGQDHPKLLCSTVETRGFSWIQNTQPALGEEFFVQARHREGPNRAVLTHVDESGNCRFNLLEAIHGVAIGQVLGVWRGEESLGSGVIEETWDIEEKPLSNISETKSGMKEGSNEEVEDQDDGKMAMWG